MVIAVAVFAIWLSSLLVVNDNAAKCSRALDVDTNDRCHSAPHAVGSLLYSQPLLLVVSLLL